MENLNDSGTALAKVAAYYGFIENVNSLNVKIVCPFHDDVNPSLMMNFENGSWFCFGCNASGDALSFVKMIEKKKGKNDLEACKVFSVILRFDNLKDIYISKKSQKKASGCISRTLYNKAYDYYHGLLTTDWEGGLSFEEKDVLEYMENRGFSKKVLKLAKAKYTFSKHYPIVFPMLDNGKFKGWVCRTTDPEIGKFRKYLYNKGFSRSTTLVGFYGEKNHVIIVEGFMDRLKFLQYGETNVVAILGWKITDNQVKKLREKGITHVISALDNDECGKKGSAYLRKFFNVTRYSFLKGMKDPGDFTEEIFKKTYKRTMSRFKDAKEAENGSCRQDQE